MKQITKDLAVRSARFNKALSYYERHSITPQRAKLRCVAELKTGGDKLNFLFTKDESLAHPLEMLLAKGDLFLTSAIGAALMIEKDGEAGISPLMSYPIIDGVHLPLGLKGFTNLNVLAVYNGKMSMKTGGTVNFSRLPMDEFLFIPETQPSETYLHSFNIENVMVQTEESYVFTGSKKQPIEIDFPIKQGMDFGVPVGYKAYVVLIFDGLLLETGATEDMKLPKDGIKNPYAPML